MKNSVLIILTLSLFIFSDALGQKKLEEKFLTSVEQARSRIDWMHSNGELATVQYEDEKEVVRQAEQVAELIMEDKKVDASTLNDWIKKLNKLGVPEHLEGAGVQYNEKAWENDARSFDALMRKQRAMLTRLRKQGEISTVEYDRRLKTLEEIEDQAMKIREEVKGMHEGMKGKHKEMQELREKLEKLDKKSSDNKGDGNSGN
ncbi:MAG: hypothetical protein R3345_01055 [Fulvivirga sp.]|nr:hypothetical protein [Fulvivirga sp.]